MTTNPNEIISVQRGALEQLQGVWLQSQKDAARQLHIQYNASEDSVLKATCEALYGPPHEATQKVLVDKDDLQQACGLLRYLANIPGNSPKFSLIESLEKAMLRANAEELKQMGDGDE